MRDRITFRPVAESDQPFLRALYGSTREQEMQMLPWTPEQKAEFLDFQFLAQTKHYDDYYGQAEFLIIELDRSPIGRLYLHRRDADIEIIDIALLPEHRAKGLGRQLLQEVIDEASRGGKTVTIYVEHFNPARHLYDRLGFQHVDTNGVYHLMKWSGASA
jgi:RimJ/RimL family protein N-acetyltransferase